LLRLLALQKGLLLVIDVPDAQDIVPAVAIKALKGIVGKRLTYRRINERPTA
jgi:hypothetical protein